MYYRVECMRALAAKSPERCHGPPPFRQGITTPICRCAATKLWGSRTAAVSAPPGPRGRRISATRGKRDGLVCTGSAASRFVPRCPNRSYSPLFRLLVFARQFSSMNDRARRLGSSLRHLLARRPPSNCWAAALRGSGPEVLAAGALGPWASRRRAAVAPSCGRKGSCAFSAPSVCVRPTGLSWQRLVVFSRQPSWSGRAGWLESSLQRLSARQNHNC